MDCMNNLVFKLDGEMEDAGICVDLPECERLNEIDYTYKSDHFWKAGAGWDRGDYEKVEAPQGEVFTFMRDSDMYNTKERTEC